MSFVERHGLWSKEQQEAASRLRKIVEEKNLEVIRLSFPDQHGILRGKTLVASEAIASLESGCSITTTMPRLAFIIRSQPGTCPSLRLIVFPELRI